MEKRPRLLPREHRSSLPQTNVTEKSYLLQPPQSNYQHPHSLHYGLDSPQSSNPSANAQCNVFYCFSRIRSKVRSLSKLFPSRSQFARNLAHTSTIFFSCIFDTILIPCNGCTSRGFQNCKPVGLSNFYPFSPTNQSDSNLSYSDSSPLLLPLTTDMERRRINIIRMSAVAITALFMVRSVSCMMYNETNTQQIAENTLLGNISQSTPEQGEGLIEKLRTEFKEWVRHNQRDYGTDTEHEKRFHIWKDNHFRTIEKNKKHGHCKMMKQPVFGSNHFKDLTTEEFKAKYLTGYNGPNTDELNRRNLRTKVNNSNNEPMHHSPHHNVVTSDGMHDATQIPRHHSVQERYLKHVKNTPTLTGSYDSNCYGKENSKEISSHKMSSHYVQSKKRCNGHSEDKSFTWTSNARTSAATCSWWDASCWLQSIFSPVYGSSTTKESTYNQYSYPTSMDWREMNAITDVHSQGSCGACWAITAVETIESVHYIKYGTLVDLSETEIIMCDDTCEMCNGGWPQNAYEFVMKNGGALPRQNLMYDGDLLMVLSMVSSGESDEMTEGQVEEFLQSTCPAENDSTTRYGNIKSYAYATDRCTCYTDGTGCDCDKQNEALAVRNLASYGPATICLDASVWQDYSGGILTTDSGCSSAFLDMNHCVQAVGYAFTDASDDDNNGSDSHSHSGDEDSKREGYWIVRNQWSSYWGMNGYIYVAMGENTCGVLNDMTQVFI